MERELTRYTLGRRGAVNVRVTLDVRVPELKRRPTRPLTEPWLAPTVVAAPTCPALLLITDDY
jgi:hypothetical protein